MAARDVAALGSLVLQIASTIQQIGNNWYMASNAWREFSRKVESLDRKRKFWEAQFSSFGMSSDAHLMEALSAAKSLLEAEKDKLEKGQNSCSSRCISKLSMTVFPAKVGLSIQTAIDAFDEIPDFLKLEEESSTALQNRVLNKPRSLPFRNDEHNRYVKLEVSEREIQSALSKPEGPNVVLLHGGAGRGKSTLSRHMALQYEEHASFDRVVFLECGQKLEKLSKQMELLQFLGRTAMLRSDPGQCSSDSSIPTLLQSALKCQKILMVLDDLWDRDFLQEMVDLFGIGVKCLVTSQDADLCGGLNFAFSAVKIQMEKEDSKKILASHVGFSNHLVPANLDNIVETIVQKAEGHPLALALIATAIDSDRKNELRTWESAFEEFSKVLRNSKRTNHVVGANYSKKFFSAMQLPIQRLSNDARQLLVLAHLCCGSGPLSEEVVTFLYKYGHFQEGGGTFGALRRELQSLELLQIRTCSNCAVSLEHRQWSSHSFQHFFIENEMREEKTAMITRLSGLLDRVDSLSRGRPSSKITDEETMMVLCALNSYPNFALKVAAKMEIPTHRFDLMRKFSIEPICLLLGQPQSARWPADAESSARQVLVTYICKGALHNDAISHMLSFPPSREPMLRALSIITRAERTSLLNESTHGLVEVLIRLFAQRDIDCRVNNGEAHVMRLAAGAIRCLASNSSDRAFLISSGALNEALELLSFEFHSGLQHATTVQRSTEPITVPETQCFTNLFTAPEHLLYPSSTSLLLIHAAMAVLLSLTQDQCEETKLRVAHTPGILEQLIKFLSKDNHPEMQTSAAQLLAHVGTSKLTVSKIVNIPNALEQLTVLMSNDTHSPHDR